MVIDTADNGRNSKSSRAGSRRRLPVGLRAIRLAFGTFGRLLPRMAGLMAYTMAFRPDRKRQREGFAALLEEATVDTSMICNGKTVTSYAWSATGPAVLLVHGWESSASRFSRLISRLSLAGYRV